MKQFLRQKNFLPVTLCVICAVCVILLFPLLCSLIHVSSYLNLKSGNVRTVCGIAGITIREREEVSVLSSRLPAYGLHPRPEWLHIREKHGFGRLHLKNGRCFTELYFLFLEKEEKGGVPSEAEVSVLLSRYGIALEVPSGRKEPLLRAAP